MKKKQIRPLGEILLELEVLIDEMIDTHDLQTGDILNQIYGHLEIHRPDAVEIYSDGSGSPTFFYGYRE